MNDTRADTNGGPARTAGGDAVDRRRFLSGALAASAVTIIPASAAPRAAAAQARGKRVPPSEKVRLACIGIGGRGNGLTKSFNQCDEAAVVALCDADMDSGRTAEVRKMFPSAPTFQDFRVLFERMADDIDAVSVAVPDHAHFPICMLAMSLGKHVYVEKPLAHTFQEIELLMACARKNGVVTQMGNQGHSGANYFQFKSWTEAGVIKNVTKVIAHMNSPRRWHGWTIDGYPEEPVPETLDWDVWLATRPHRPFSGKLHPGNWRSWYDFGNGAFGDWGPHILDTTHRFLDLGLPTVVEAERRDGPNPFIFPQASTIRFDFPARGDQPPVSIYWYDGVDNLPPRPAELEDDRQMGRNGKIIYAGDLVFKGGTHASPVRIIPESRMKELTPTLPKITGRHSNHYHNFILACRGEEESRSPFDVSGPLTQVFMLGVIAQRLGGRLTFDPTTKTITNNAEANRLLTGLPPRPGWDAFYRLA